VEQLMEDIGDVETTDDEIKNNLNDTFKELQKI